MGTDTAIAVRSEDIIEPEATFVPQQLSNEPDMWYFKFLKFFLNVGSGRSVAGAYRAYCRDSHPDRLNEDGKVEHTPQVWAAMARQFEWRERAAEYDRHQTLMVVDSVALALEILRDAGPDAAVALVTALGNPKQQVAAAREILDRIGVPRKTVQETVSLRITPDDIKKAREETEDWEKKTYGMSG